MHFNQHLKTKTDFWRTALYILRNSFGTVSWCNHTWICAVDGGWKIEIILYLNMALIMYCLLRLKNRHSDSALLISSTNIVNQMHYFKPMMVQRRCR